MLRLALLRVLLATVLSTLAAQGARAQDPASDLSEPDGYRVAIDEAIAEYDAGHFAESRALFQRAHELSPSARTLRGVGMTEFELRSYPASVGFLEQALASSTKPLDGDLRARTDALLERARSFVGRFAIVLEPSDAALKVDGAEPLRDTAGAVMIGVGDHSIEVSAEGRASVRRRVRVTGGERRELRIALPMQQAVAPKPSTDTTPGQAAAGARATATQQEDESIFSSPWLWTAVGAVVVGSAVGVGLVIGLGGDTRTEAPYGGDTGTVLSGP